MSFREKWPMERRLTVFVLATLMVCLLAGCGVQSGGVASVLAGAEDVPCQPGVELGIFEVQAQSDAEVGNGSNGSSVCRGSQETPVISNAGLTFADARNSGLALAASPTGQSQANPDSSADLENTDSKNAASESDANFDTKSDPKQEQKQDPKQEQKQDPKQNQKQNSILDKPTEPAMVYKGKSDAKLVALTFDDGPDNRYTPEILDILKAKHVHATFFTVGLQVKKYGSVMKRIVKEGNEIGNHSYSHKDMSKLDSTAILNQIKWTDTLIARQTGFVPRYIRPPYGATSPLLKQIVADNERKLVLWTVDTRDWAGSTVAAMRANVNKNTHPGGIILMHSFGSRRVDNTVQLLPLIIKDLQAKGYTFVTVGELLDAKAKSQTPANK